MATSSRLVPSPLVGEGTNPKSEPALKPKPTVPPPAAKVALVTGAASGIGRAAAVALARAGADVAVNDLRVADDVVKEIQSLGRRALACPADVSDQAAVERITDETVSKLGSLDLYVS